MLCIKLVNYIDKCHYEVVKKYMFFYRYFSLHISPKKLISKFCQAAFQENFKFSKCICNEAVMSYYH